MGKNERERSKERGPEGVGTAAPERFITFGATFRRVSDWDGFPWRRRWGGRAGGRGGRVLRGRLVARGSAFTYGPTGPLHFLTQDNWFEAVQSGVDVVVIGPRSGGF